MRSPRARGRSTDPRPCFCIARRIIRFRTYYAAAGGLGIVLILLFIRWAVGGITGPVRVLARTAEQVAGGRYGERLPVQTGDEIGQLNHSFNAMVDGLGERDFIRNTFGRYVDREVAQEILRKPDPERWCFRNVWLPGSPRASGSGARSR